MNLTKKNMKKIMMLIVFFALMLWCVFNYKLAFDLVTFIIKLFMPLIVGIAIAFVINIPMKNLENKVFKIEKRKHKKIIRALSLIISILLLFGIVALIMFLVIPGFVDAIMNLSKQFPNSYNWINELIEKINKLYPSIGAYFSNINYEEVLAQLMNKSGNIITIFISFLTKLISRIIILFVGFIISLYILIDKENLSRQAKKILRALTNDKVYDEVLKVVKLTNTTFTNFFTGQCLDASLIGTLLFIILSILKLPYALVLGALFAITALIPYVGAFIALVVGVVLIGSVNPMGALWYTLVFFTLQQFDDSFTHPKIVGGSVGLPAIWSFLAALIGGSVFGFIGIIISIPLASIVYTIVGEKINKKLEKKEE